MMTSLARMPVLAGLLLWFSVAAAAQTPPAPSAPSNDDCLMCHGDKDSAVRADKTSVHVDAQRYGASLHGQMRLTCVACHTDLATAAEWPHAEKLAPPDCSNSSISCSASLGANCSAGPTASSKKLASMLRPLGAPS